MRNRVSMLACVAAISAMSSLLVFSTVDAQRARRGRRARPARVVEAPRSAAIAPALGNLHWGMSPREVFDQINGEIQTRFRPQLAKVAGAVEEDRLRAQMAEETRVLRASFLRFRGQTSGWDSSFLRDEYTHNNNESMMILREAQTQNFYFFIGDRLWKIYKAFNAAAFAGQNFEQFHTAIEERFGRGVVREGALVEGRDPTQWVEWQDATTRLRAVDNTRFYNFYCLVFEDKETVGRLAQLRTNASTRQENRNELVDSVLRQEGGETADSNSDIADRLTGVRVRNQQAPAPTTPARQGSATPSAAPAGGTREPESNLDGLEL